MFQKYINALAMRFDFKPSSSEMKVTAAARIALNI